MCFVWEWLGGPTLNLSPHEDKDKENDQPVAEKVKKMLLKCNTIRLAINENCYLP